MRLRIPAIISGELWLVGLLFVSVSGGFGCDKAEPSASSTRAGAPPQSAEGFDPKNILPEYYGSYAIDHGKTVTLRDCKKSGDYDLEAMPDLGPTTELIFYDRSVKAGGDIPKLLLLGKDGAEVETRQKPVPGHDDMIRLVPVRELQTGAYSFANTQFWVQKHEFMRAHGDEIEQHQDVKMFVESGRRLRKIFAALVANAQDNNGRFPSNLSAITAQGIDTSSPFHKEGTDPDFVYLYFDGLIAGDAETAIAYDAAALTSRGKTNVLFADGHVGSYDQEGFEKTITFSQRHDPRSGKLPGR